MKPMLPAVANINDHGSLETPDGVLVEKTLKGEQEAFRLLWVRHAPNVRAVVNRFTYQPADTDDLTQEVFLKAFRSLGRFRGDSQFSTWLYRIAINTGINFRQSKFAVEFTNADLLETLDPLGPEDICLDSESTRRTESAIEGLAPLLKEALLLNVVKGHDYRTISALVDCPLGTVRSRLSRARGMLSEALAI